MDIFWGSSQNWAIFLFFKIKVQNGGYFWAAKISNIFFGVLEIPDIFGLKGFFIIKKKI